MKSKLITLLIFTILLSSCKQDKANDKDQNTVYQDKDPLTKQETILTEIKDTLIVGQREFGDIYVVRILEDSIRRSKGDAKAVDICLNMYSKDFNIKDINEKNCDTFYQATLDFTKIRVPFFITPKKTGKMSIKGVVRERISLESYQYNDSTEVRYLEYESYFEKDIYVKDTISNGTD